MKFYRKKLTMMTLVIFCFFMEYILTINRNLLKTKDKSKKLRIFIYEAKSHIGNYKKCIGSNCVKNSIIWNRAFEVYSKVIEALKLKSSNFYFVRLENSLKGTTTLVFSSLGVKSSQAGLAASLYRICVPSDINKKPFVDLRCPLHKCPDNLKQIKKGCGKLLRGFKRLTILQSSEKMKFPNLTRRRI